MVEKKTGKGRRLPHRTLRPSRQARDVAIPDPKTLVVPLKPASAPPLLTPRPDVKESYFASLPGARLIDEKDVFPGPDSNTYAFYRRSSRTNLYRLRLP